MLQVEEKASSGFLPTGPLQRARHAGRGHLGQLFLDRSAYCCSTPAKMSLIPLAVIAFSSASALITEFLQWALVWRTPGFVALKANLAKHAAKVEEAKEGSTSKKNLSKREARLENWRKEASRQVASYNMKAGFVVSAPKRSWRCRHSHCLLPVAAAAVLGPTVLGLPLQHPECCALAFCLSQLFR